MKDKKLLDRLMENPALVRVLSVVLAFIVWLAVVINVSPSYTRTIADVPVTIDTQNGFLTEAGLGLVDKMSEKVSIVVTGPRAVIGKLASDDFSVAPDVGPVTKSGSYSLKLAASLKTPNSQVKIRSVSPADLQMSFDTVSSKTLPVTVNVTSRSVADGYVMETATASPKEVIISGPSAEVSRVQQVIADVDTGANLRATYNGKVALKLTDANGAELELAHVKQNVSQVAVTVPVFKTNAVPLKVGFSNVPAGFNTQNIQYSINPASLHVAGSAEEIATLSQIKLDDIDFNTLSLQNQITLPIRLSGTLQNLDNLGSAQVTVNLLDTAAASVSTQNLQAVNVPAGYTVKMRTTQIENIRLFGPAGQMAAPPALTAVADLSKVFNGTGQYVVPMTIQVPSGFWTTGEYTAVIQVSRK